jgi:hypothetical protein
MRTVVSAVVLTGCGLIVLGGLVSGRTVEDTGQQLAAPSPTTATMATPDQLRRLDQAQELLISRCMQDQGFTYVVVPPDPMLADDRDFPYGIDDVDWAGQHGLGLAERAAAADRAGAGNPNRQYLASLGASRQRAYDAALFGTVAATVSVTVPTGDLVTMNADGCLSSAQDQLYGDFRRWFETSTIVSNLSPVIEPLVQADPRFQQRVSRWSGCMAGLGHDYQSPADLRAQLQRVSFAQERAIAVAEATCVRRTDLAAFGYQLDEELGAPVRDRYRAEIETHRQLQAAALKLIDTGDGVPAIN